MNTPATDYQYKTKPFAHQHESFMLTRDAADWGYLFEMGLGKTKVTLDVAAWNYAKERINFLLILAPSGVHTNWINDEIPAHLPEWTNYVAAEWGSNMKRAEQDKVDAVFHNYKSFPRLRVLAMNIEAFQTPDRYYNQKAGKLVRAIMNTFNVMFVMDESSYIKTPGTSRTTRSITLAQHAKMRRILNGTPITNGPLDLYSQFKFLQGGGVRPGNGNILLGPYAHNFSSFKARYAEYEVRVNHAQRDKNGKFQEYEALIGYRNLDELSAHMLACSTRLTKKECLDLPAKLYEKIPCELHPEQARRYKQVIDEKRLELKRGEVVTITSVLTLWLRLQQIVGGFVPTADDEAEDKIAECILDDFEKLPRVQNFRHYIEQVQSGKVIIVCRFLAEVKMWKTIYGDAAVTYVGLAHYKDASTREVGKVRFQGTKEKEFEDHDPTIQYMITNKAGARGLTLTQASAVFYYSNSFSLDDRLQSEDRPHRIGQRNPVTYFDGVATGTIDEKLVAAYRDKKRLADVINKDDPTTWI